MKILGSVAALAAAMLLLTIGPAHAASPALVFINNGDTLVFQAGPGTANNVGVFRDAQGRVAVSDPAGITGSGGCPVVGNVAHCGTAITHVQLNVLDGNDRITPEAAVSIGINAGPGRDTVRGGFVRGGASQIVFNGGPDVDRIDYSSADRFVTLALDDIANDGRPGDLDNIRPDVEELVGSALPDRITGNQLANVIEGGAGADILGGLGGDDSFREGRFANGADQISGGSGVDAVRYSERLAAVTVNTNGVADDGAAGEADNVGVDVENLSGGSGADSLIGGKAANELIGGPGIDTFDGGAGADTLFARDLIAENVKCGKGADSAQVDTGLDVPKGCETLL